MSKSEEIVNLTRRLVEAEAALRAVTAGQVDAVVDPDTGLPILLSGAQVELRRAHDELEESVRQRNAELTLTNETLQDEISRRERVQENLRSYAHRLKVLHETDQAILATRSAHEIAEMALQYAPQLMGCEWASITLFDLEPGELTLLAVSSKPETGSTPVAWLSPLVDETAMEHLRRGDVYSVEDVHSLPPSISEIMLAKGIKAFANVPLLIQGKVAGSLNVAMGKSGYLTSKQVSIAHQLATQVAIAIQQSQLNQQLRRYAEEMEAMVALRTAALKESEARFRTIFEDSVLGIALLDRDGRILASNRALQNMLGFSEQELMGMNFRSRDHAEDAEANKKLYQALASGNLDYYQAERRFIRRDGRERWSNLTISRVKKTSQNDPDLVIIIADDVTEKRMTQEALRHAERLTIAGRLGTSLANDINNPLQAVVGCLGLIEEMLDGETEMRSYLTVAMDELERAAKIVTQLRDLSRDTDSKKEPTDINVLLERVMLLTKKHCQGHAVDVSWNRVDDIPYLLLAPTHMQQVFLNLVLNAAEAMPGGGKLHISTHLIAQPKGILVIFADTRPQADPAKLAEIFDPLYSPRSGDLELGLYISKKIVEEHGGRIDVDIHAGEGTEFTVWLPQ